VDLRPPTDDWPFFYKWEPGVPPKLVRLLVGTVVPALALLVVALLVGQRSGRRAGALAPVYFALLGAGYVVLEVALVHKAAFFLGAPAYSLAATLGGLLAGGGLGSVLLAPRVSRLGARAFVAPVGVALLALVAWGGLPLLFDAFLGASLPARVVLVFATMFPAGVLMGVPFPVGLGRLVEGGRSEGIPWAWAANGVFSVAGSVGTVVLAVGFGFGAAFPAGALLYGLAAVALTLVGRP
jgi:hypothetical protein